MPGDLKTYEKPIYFYLNLYDRFLSLFTIQSLAIFVFLHRAKSGCPLSIYLINLIKILNIY